MVDLAQFRENATLHGLCQEYENFWDSCKSNKQLADMGFSTKGLDYICDAIAKGWGVSPDVISSKLSPFINGKYVSNQKGYTSKMYCQYDGEITANPDTTIFGLIECKANIHLSKNSICDFFCTGNCDIKVDGEGMALFICYGDPSNIRINSEGAKVRRKNKKERDHYA